MKPLIYYNKKGESGNIFVILGQVMNSIPEKDFEECLEAVKKCNNYDEALDVVQQYVDLFEISKYV